MSLITYRAPNSAFRTKTFSVFSAALVMSFSCSSAGAQTIDYGSLEQLFGEPVTTSVTGSPQRVTDAPANMEIVTADDIRRSGAENIPDILRFVAGIDVRQYGANQAEVAVRGYNQAYSPRLLVLINGRQVYLDEYGYTVWETLPVALDEIRQIEVVKGPNSALFGYNALAGVINIITYDPIIDSTNTVTVRGGSNNFVDGSAVGTIPLGERGGVRLSVRGNRMDEYPTNALPPVAIPLYATPYSYSLGADGRFAVAPGVSFTAEATFSKLSGFEIAPTPTITPRVDYTTHSFKLGVDAESKYGLLNLTAYRNGLSTTFDTGLKYIGHNRVYVLRASDLFKIGANHTVRVGLEYRNNVSDGDAHAGTTIGYNVYSASAMWNWRISPALSLTNAVRVDYLKLHLTGYFPAGQRYTRADFDHTSLTEPSFNSGLVYQPTANDTFRFMIARGIQAPSLFDFGSQINTTLGSYNLVFAGNPDLKPATLMNYEINYDRTFEPILSRLRLAVYYQKTHNLLTSALNVPPTLGPMGLVSYSQNFGSSDAFGGQLGLEGKSPSGWRWDVNYSVVSIRDQSILGDDGFSSVLSYDKGSPISVVRASLGYTWNKLEVDVQSKLQSHFTDYIGDSNGIVSPFRIGGHLTVNARIGYNVTDHITLAITGERLTRPRAFEAAGSALERRFFCERDVTQVSAGLARTPTDDQGPPTEIKRPSFTWAVRI